jgi:transcriptional regulator with XRE-family HTH domain
MADDRRSQPQTLAEKVDRLFKTVHPPRGEYSHEDVASAIRESGGPTISATYLWQLRKGIRDNPTMKHMQALSGFFGVPPSYFFDETTATQVDADLELLTAMRDTAVRDVALRVAGLSAETLSALSAVIERARQLEGLKEGPVPSGRRGPRGKRKL